jgi:hypothetical protein
MDSDLLNLDISSLLPPDTTVIPHSFGRYLTGLVRLDLSPCPIESIGYDCFKYAYSLQELKLSRETYMIRSGSFRDLTSLQILDLSPYQMLQVLDHDTFVNACSLRRLILPEGLVEIRSGSFRDLTSLQILDLSPYQMLRVLDHDTFVNAYSLQELKLSRETYMIRSGSFRDLTSLQILDLSPYQMLQVLDHDTFVNACSLRRLILPEGLVEIRSGALRGLTSLEILTVPASVMRIWFGAFGGCINLKQVIFKGCTEIDPNAFKGCHPNMTFVHHSSSKVEGCRLQPVQAAAGGGEMEVAVGAPSMHPDSSSLHQSSSEVEGCRLQPGQAAGGGEMEVAVDQPSVHPNSPFRFRCYIGRYDALKKQLQFGQDANGFMCQIKYEEFVDDMEIVILPCGHAFSVIGMSEWYSKECEDTCCPSCMKKLH